MPEFQEVFHKWKNNLEDHELRVGEPKPECMLFSFSDIQAHRQT